MARPKKQKGLGDTIEAVLTTTGIKKIFEIFVDGEDCGCDKRKEKLNELFPYRFKARCLTELEYNSWKDFKEVRTLKISWAQIVYVCDLYASVFSRQTWYPCSGCSPKPLINMIDKLDKVFDAYEN
jgi:hypothetical protein